MTIQKLSVFIEHYVICIYDGITIISVVSKRLFKTIDRNKYLLAVAQALDSSETWEGRDYSQV